MRRACIAMLLMISLAGVLVLADQKQPPMGTSQPETDARRLYEELAQGKKGLVIDVRNAKVEPLKALARFSSPTLVIRPEEDEYLPRHYLEDFFRAARAKKKEKIIIAGADHTFTSIAWEREVIKHTVEWIARIF